MIWGFDTDNEHVATGALLVYAIYRSRDRGRFKVTPDMWAQIERFVKASAKRAATLGQFIETLKPRLACAEIRPRAIAVGLRGVPTVSFAGGAFAELDSQADSQREFGLSVIEQADHARVLDHLYRETSYVVMAVRERLERERAVEARIATDLDAVMEDD